MGTKKPMDFMDRAQNLAQDRDNRLDDPDDYLAAVEAAVLKYSQHRPATLVAEITGNSTNDLTLPTDWVDGFSAIVSAEYPMDQIPAVFVDANEVYTFKKASGLVLRLENDKPVSPAKVRFTYTGYHLAGVDGAVGTAAASSIPDGDFEAVAALAASYACTQLATQYASGVDPGISADMVDGTSRAEEFRKRSAELEQRYLSAMGLRSMIEMGGNGQSFIDLDTTIGGTGAPMVTHPKRWV